MGKKKSFASRLVNKLEEFGKGSVEHDGDEKCSWVEININGITLSFGFDAKGENITDIGLFKDVVEVTGQERIWQTK